MSKVEVITSGYVSFDRIIKIRQSLRLGFTSIIENKDNTQIKYGGCGVNVAYSLSKLGRVSMPVIRIGEDHESSEFLKFLKAGGVCTDMVDRVLNENTSTSYILQDKNGQHITLFYPGSMAEEYFRKLDKTRFREAKLGVITVGTQKDNKEFLSKCKENNLPIVFGMKSDEEAFPEEFLEEILESSRIIFMNESERREIENKFGRQVTEYLTKGRAEIIVVTLGDRGSECHYKTEKGVVKIHIPIYEGDKFQVVDTTGSGDAFMAGFLFAYLSLQKPRVCCEYGTILSSFIIEKEGCLTNVPEIEKLQERYNRYYVRR